MGGARTRGGGRGMAWGEEVGEERKEEGGEDGGQEMGEEVEGVRWRIREVSRGLGRRRRKGVSMGDEG